MVEPPKKTSEPSRLPYVENTHSLKLASNGAIYKEFYKYDGFDFSVKTEIIQSAVANAEPDVVRHILSHMPVMTDSNSSHIIHWAVQHGLVDAVEILLDLGVDVNTIDRQSKTPMFYAAKHNKVDVMKILIERNASIEDIMGSGLSPLCGAANSSAYEAAKFLIKSGATFTKGDITTNHDPLINAILNEDFAMVKILLEAGANVRNFIKGVDMDVIDLIKKKNSIKRVYSDNPIYPRVKIQDAFFEKLSQINPLHMAILMANLSIATLLIESGAQIESKTHCENTPLGIAILMDNIILVKLLIDKGADIEAKCTNCRKPIDLAQRCLSNDIMSFLEKTKFDREEAKKLKLPQNESQSEFEIGSDFQNVYGVEGTFVGTPNHSNYERHSDDNIRSYSSCCNDDCDMGCGCDIL